MYICLCKGITDKQIRQAVEDGADSLRAVRRELGVSSQCGQCACEARGIIRETLQESRSGTSSFPQPLAAFYAA